MERWKVGNTDRKENIDQYSWQICVFKCTSILYLKINKIMNKYDGISITWWHSIPRKNKHMMGLHLSSEDNSMSRHPPKFKTPGDMDY